MAARAQPAQAGEKITLAWKDFAGTFAVVWKVRGVPVVNDFSCVTEAETKGSKKSLDKHTKPTRGAKGRGKSAQNLKIDGNVSGLLAGGAKPSHPEVRELRRAPEQSVCDWVEQQFGGKWIPLYELGTESAGLVLLECQGRHVKNTPAAQKLMVRGTYAVLVAPQTPPVNPLADSAVSAWEPLELFGGPLDETRVVSEGPSGHFGRLALLELDMDLVGVTSPLAVVLALQELGFLVVQLGGARGGAELRHPQLIPQSCEQVDVTPGTCISVIGLEAPGGTRRMVRHEPPSKFSKLLNSERALAEQRRQPADGVISFRGLSLLVPSEQLRPRRASEAVVDAALEVLNKNSWAEPCILDLGVGSGALLVAILQSLDHFLYGTGVDIDAGAVSACETNVSRILVPEKAARVQIVPADFGQLDATDVRQKLAPQGYHLIVCNPPYRSEAQQAAYEEASGQCGGYAESKNTLVAGKTGFELYEAVAACIVRDAANAARRNAMGDLQLAPLLRSDGILIFQVEAGHGGRCGGMAMQVGAAIERASGGQLIMHSVHTDANGLERAIIVKYGG